MDNSKKKPLKLLFILIEKFYACYNMYLKLPKPKKYIFQPCVPPVFCAEKKKKRRSMRKLCEKVKK